MLGLVRGLTAATSAAELPGRATGAWEVSWVAGEVSLDCNLELPSDGRHVNQMPLVHVYFPHGTISGIKCA